MLTPKQPDSVSSGVSALDVAVSPDGESVYVASTQASNLGAVTSSASDPGTFVSEGSRVGAVRQRAERPRGTPLICHDYRDVRLHRRHSDLDRSRRFSSATFDLYGAQGGSSHPRTQTGDDGAPGGKGADLEAMPRWKAGRSTRSESGSGHQRLGVVPGGPVQRQWRLQRRRRPRNEQPVCIPDDPGRRWRDNRSASPGRPGR